MAQRNSSALAVVALIMFSSIVAGCVSDEKYEKLKEERDRLLVQIKTSNDTAAIETYRSDVLATINAIYSDSFDPLADQSKVDALLSADKKPIQVAAMKSDAAVVVSILDAYRQALGLVTPRLTDLSTKVQKLESDISNIKKQVAAAASAPSNDKFFRVSLMLGRKFDEDAEGYSYFEAVDMRGPQRVVAKVPQGIKAAQNFNLSSYARNLGDMPVTVTNSNSFRSFETKEYLPVLLVATQEERIALSGGTEDLRKLEVQLAEARSKLSEATAMAKDEVSINLASRFAQIQAIADPSRCHQPNRVLSAESSENKSIDPAAHDSTPDSAEATSDTNSHLYAQCVKELKEFVTNDSGTFTEANDLAIKSNCRKTPTQALCFAKKARDAGGMVSLAERKTFERDCQFY